MQKTLADVTQGAFKLALQILKQPADAQDVLQDSAAVAISHTSAPKANSADFRPWFFRVVRNKAIDRLREMDRRHAQEFDEQLGDGMASSSLLNPEEELQKQQLKEQVKTALALLPVKQREIILLKDYHQMSYLEIAEVLGVPKGTVMSKLHRARLALQQVLRIQ